MLSIDMGRHYEIGPFHLDTEARVLLHEGHAVALGARAVGVLTVLVAHPHEYIQKAAILDAAWPGLMVEEANLAVQVSAIRRALACVPGGERWIETLQRRGYRFVGPVVERETGARLADGMPFNVPSGASELGDRHPVIRHNLPERISSFVGRENEIAEVKRLLAQHRLVSLVGVGGIGKTRVALQIAADLFDSHPDGVWLVELGAISDPRLVAACAAQALGLPEQRGESPAESLCRHLGSHRSLLVLDTCEHVIDATADLVASILSGTRHCRILVTSREALDVDGEQRVPLPPLSLPPVAAAPEDAMRFEAIRLFIDRARLQRPDFAPVERQNAAVAAICRSLDGLPLAIELAAARVSVLSVEDIERRLSDRFRLLEGGSRASPPRQRTLRATLDWSHALLTQDEQRVLRRLAVFAGSFDGDSARSVAGIDLADGAAMVHVLSRCVAQSILVADTGGAGTRYRLLDTVRAYLHERLDQAGERTETMRRYAQNYCERFRSALEDWLNLSDAAWDAAYACDRDHVRAALDWSFSSEGDVEIGVAFAANSGPGWLVWSLRGEGLDRLEAALARCSARTPQGTQARLWLWVGVLRQFRSMRDSVRALRRSVELNRRLGDAIGTGYALIRLAGGLARSGRPRLARRVLDASSPLIEGGSTLAGPYFHISGFIRKSMGDLEAARADCVRSLAAYQSAGADRSALEIRGSLADTLWALGSLDAALAEFREIVAQMRSSARTTKLALGVNLTNLAGVLTELGALEEALEVAREGLPACRDAGYVLGALDHLALRAALAGKLAEAARLAGYGDSNYAVGKSHRQPNEARARMRLQRLLLDQPNANDLLRELADGARISEDDACRLALSG
jgi:predicted ATPase/DNA-binding winged helix-turn-helix (wHTH) protein